MLKKCTVDISVFCAKMIALSGSYWQSF